MRADWGIKIFTRIFFGMGRLVSPLCHRFIIKIFGSEYFRIFYSANWRCHKVTNSLMMCAEGYLWRIRNYESWRLWYYYFCCLIGDNEANIAILHLLDNKSCVEVVGFDADTEIIILLQLILWEWAEGKRNRRHIKHQRAVRQKYAAARSGKSYGKQNKE